MGNAYSMGDLLDFLSHASERGLMPAATATSLAVAVRNVLSVLTESEQDDLSRLDIDAVIKRFVNKRARDFNPSSLKEYGRRVHRAIDLFQRWRDDPSNFSVKTRATNAARKKQRNGGNDIRGADTADVEIREPVTATQRGAYSSSIPIRTDWVVTVTNIPADLTNAEAERLATFIRMLAVE